MPTVLIAGGGTGGHLMPALAIATRLRERWPEVEPVLIGAERGVERDILPTRDFRHYLLPAEPIYRRQWWRNLRWPILAWRLLAQVRRILQDESPVAVLGTGGYAAGPVLWEASRRGIPCALQEQNAVPGVATRWLARRVRHIYLGVPEIRAGLPAVPHASLFDTGNPVVPADPSRRGAARERFGLAPGLPVVLVTGGSQGALALNRAVAQALETGSFPSCQLIWATGRGTHDEFRHWHAPPGRTVVDFLDPIADAYAVADLAITRAGASTLAELCVWGLPSILIPLPTAAADHQMRNAEAMAEAGASIMLKQGDLSGERLGREVSAILQDPALRQAMSEAARSRGRPHAVDEIVSRFSTLWQQGRSFATYGESVN